MDMDTFTPTPQAVRIAEGHQGRMGRATKTMLFIGPETPEELAIIAAAAADDTLVAVTPSVSAWIETTGIPDPDMDRIVSEHIILFPAFPMGTTADAWDRANELVEHLSNLGAKKVAIAKLPQNSAGLAATLDGQSAATRVTYVASLIARAEPLTKRRPAALKKRGGGVKVALVEWEKGQIAEYVGDDKDSAVVLLDAAVRRLRTRELVDDLNDTGRKNVGQIHDLEVAHFVDGQLREEIITGVPDSHLSAIRTWLGRLPDSRGVDIALVTEKQEAIAEAIRQADKELVERQLARTRTGWIVADGELMFLHQGGAITAHGNVTRAAAELEGALQAINFPDPALTGPDLEKKLAEKQISALRELHSEHVYASVQGVIAHSVAGLGVGAAVLVHGVPGCGKTTILSAFGAQASPEFGEGRDALGTFDGTVPMVSDLGKGLHQFFVTVDDSRPKEKEGEIEMRKQVQAFDRLSRRAYAGGSAGRTKKETDSQGKWVNGHADRTDVAIILAGEEMPPAIQSTLERFWPVQIPEKDAFRSGNADLFKELTEDLGPSQHMASFIQWLAGKINAAGGLSPWREIWKDKRAELVAARIGVASKIRYAEVAAVPELGFHIWLDYIEAVGAISKKDRSVLQDTVHEQFTKNMIRHMESVVGSSIHTWQSAIDSLQAAVVSGEAYFFSPSKDAGSSVSKESDAPAGAEVSAQNPAMHVQAMLGAHVSGRKGTGQYMAILPRVAFKLLSREFSSESALIDAFQEISIRDKGKRTKKVNMFGKPVAAICVPWELWDTDWESNPEF